MGGWAHTSHPSRIIVTSRELFPKWKPGEVDDNSIVALELHPHLQLAIFSGEDAHLPIRYLNVLTQDLGPGLPDETASVGGYTINSIKNRAYCLSFLGIK